MAGLNPAMVTLVREYRGLTQGQLAVAAGITQGHLSKLESGVVDFPAAVAERLAAQLEWPIGFFYRDEARSGFTACVFHRKQSTVPMKVLRQVEATANVLRASMDPLLDEVDLGADCDFPVLDIDEYDGDIQTIASLVRSSWRLPYGPIVNLVGAVESAGGIVYRVPFGTRRFDAVSQWADHAPPLFLLNDISSGDRIRFSLSHEIGHVVMHRLPSSDMEREAQRFAAEFLMPAREIKGDLIHLDLARAALLKEHWKVSMAALIYRAKDLEVIPEWRAKALFMELSRRGWRLHEPGNVALEEPTLVRGVVDVHLVDHGASLEEVAELAGLPIDELRRHILGEPVLRAV